MKNLFLLPVIAILFLTSCTTEENYITEINLVEGAYFTELRLENQQTQITEGTTVEIGRLVFDLQGLTLRDIQVELETNNQDIADYIESISIEKIDDIDALFLQYLDVDDEDYWTSWEPQTGKEIIKGLDTYSIKITAKNNIPNNIEVEFELEIRMKNLVGNNEYFYGSQIIGNIDNIFINKN